MKKVNKTLSSKKGFTTVEMLLVIAIIVILSGITIVGIRGMIANANKNGKNILVISFTIPIHKSPVK